MFTIVHSGQTGVQRGAHRAAVATGLPVDGFMSHDGRDELGALPLSIASRLTPCPQRGPRRAVLANLALASGVLIIVPDVREARRCVGINEVMRIARIATTKMIICDPLTDPERVVSWSSDFRPDEEPVRLLVHGPRASRWGDGERVAVRLVGALGMRGADARVVEPRRTYA